MNILDSEKSVKRGITGSTLKIIAIILMAFDHIGATFIEHGVLSNVTHIENLNNKISLIISHSEWESWIILDLCLRLIGRLAFPIFCFLLVEGFLHTSNIKKYMLRVFSFAFLAEIPFNLAVNNSVLYFEKNNTLFTLLIGLVVLYFYRFFGDSMKDKFKKATVVILGMLAAVLFHTDYSFFGVGFIFLLYYFRNHKKMRTIIGVICSSCELTAPLSFLFINSYNGKRGRDLKYLFYIFYPLHLLIIDLVFRIVQF